MTPADDPTANRDAERMKRLENRLRAILREDHHWCTKGQVVNRYTLPDGTTTCYDECSCGKDIRDKKIREVLRRA